MDKENVRKPPTKSGIKDFLTAIQNTQIKKKENEEIDTSLKPSAAINPNTSNSILGVISFLESLTYSSGDGRIFIHTDKDKSKMKLQFLLLNPTENFKEVVNEARSVIVAGGTMKPISEFRDRLFVNSGATLDRIVEFSCDHIIPPENIQAIVMTRGPKEEKLLFNYESRFSMVRKTIDGVGGGS